MTRQSILTDAQIRELAGANLNGFDRNYGYSPIVAIAKAEKYTTVDAQRDPAAVHDAAIQRLNGFVEGAFNQALHINPDTHPEFWEQKDAQGVKRIASFEVVDANLRQYLATHGDAARKVMDYLENRNINAPTVEVAAENYMQSLPFLPNPPRGPGK